MKIKIVFDKDSIDDRFENGWGVSMLIGETILFDTGEKFQHLEKNIKALGSDIKNINKVIISHEHWDHTNGLWQILKQNRGVTVYGCADFSQKFKDKVIKHYGQVVDIKGPIEIAQGIHSTGQFIVDYKGSSLAEHMVVIERVGKLVLLSGCCHPGILKVSERVKEHFKKDISLVLGGLHLMDEDNRLIDYSIRELSKTVKKVGPSHCTGYEATNLFREVYRHNFIDIKSGTQIDI